MGRLPSDEYFAGLLDGEGYIGIQRHKYKQKIAYYPIVNVRMANERIIRLIKRRFGGSVGLYRQTNRKWKDCWNVSIGCRMAERLLRDLLPYLIVKKAQARAVLELAGEIKKNRRRFQVLKRRTTQMRHRLYKKLKSLNHTGK